MIGTVICRNCDTAIEVSEGDVARFRTNPVFACSVCQQDLTQRVAEMLGRSPVILGTVREPSHPPRASDPDEFTVPDDQEAFDGLPMGESFDDAALRLKAVRTPQATPVMADPQPEDPSLLALRIAGQAQAQAQALAAKALAHAASVAPMASPDSAATQPGVPLPAGAPNSPSTEVGVVPEEPENETTARRAAAENGEGSVAEPTLPSDGGDDEDGESMVERSAGSGHDERTPLVDITRTPEVSAPAFTESGVLPNSPTNEATPSVSRGNPVLVEEEPPREVTAKRSAPPPRIMRTTVPRTGTGPAGIGALGIRVVANRAVVRPASNGRSVSVPAPNAETQVTGVETHVERPSAAGRAASAAASTSASSPAPHHAPAQPSAHPPAVPFSSPRGGTARRSGGGASMWAMIGGGTLVLVIAGVFIKRAVDGPAKPSPTPYETPAIVIETEATPAPTPTETPDSATSTPTARVQATVEPTRAVVIATPVFPRNTPAPTSQQTATAVRTAAATPTAVAPTPRPAPNTADVLREAGMKGVVNDFDAAYALVRMQRPHDPSNPEVHYYLWRYASKAKGVSAEERMRLANEYLQRYRNLDADRTKSVETWVKENGVR